MLDDISFIGWAERDMALTQVGGPLPTHDQTDKRSKLVLQSYFEMTTSSSKCIEIRQSNTSSLVHPCSQGLLEAMYLQSLPPDIPVSESAAFPQPIPCHCMLIASASDHNRMAIMCPMIRPPILVKHFPQPQIPAGKPDNSWDTKDCIIALQVGICL